MKFLHQPFQAKAKDRIVVEFDQPTKVMMINTTQMKKYKGGRSYQYRGGFSKESPVEFEVPFDGVWHAVVEEGTFTKPISVKAQAKLVKPRHKTLNGAVQYETHQGVDEYDDTLE